MTRARKLADLAGLFLKLGGTAFGGPAAHIAMMEDEVVRRRKWLSPADFLDRLAAANLIPGPNSTELALHIGFERAGWLGLIVAGLCFILPAVLIVTTLAWAYETFGGWPTVRGLFDGVKPVVIVVVTQAIWNLSRRTRTPLRLALILISVAAAAYGFGELAIFVGVGVIGLGLRSAPLAILAAAVGPVPRSAWAAVTLAATAFRSGDLFLIFLKIGAVLYGSGYVLLSFLQTELVDHRHWLSTAQLLDAVAVGQFTPGPVFTTATFIGYLLGKVPGAALATLGIFLPSFVFVALSTRVLPLMKRSPAFARFLDGVNAASLGLMVMVVGRLGRETLVDFVGLAIFAVTVVLALRFRVNASWLMLGGGVVGIASRTLIG